jgi:hypothetical protein
MKPVFKSFVFVLALVAVTVFNSGCNHDKSCEAIVKVVASDGTTPVGGATVDLYATVSTQTGPVTADLKATGTTGSDGTVSFKFKLPAILDIKASKGSLVGQGIIKLEEKQKVTKTVTIQ